MTNYKEYLIPDNGGYRVAVQDAGLPIAEDWIEILEGAEALTKEIVGSDEMLFWWRDNFSKCIGHDDHLSNHEIEVCNHLERNPKPVILWQREQDEPFLTPECTLNDQYAEIEEVRQAGLKFDNGKPRHSLLPKDSISSIIAVLEFGAKKYEANNWQKVDNAKDRYYDAAMRHIDSWWNGEKFDQETGIHHLAHAATNLFFLKWFDDKENNNG